MDHVSETEDWVCVDIISKRDLSQNEELELLESVELNIRLFNCKENQMMHWTGLNDTV